MSENSGNPRNDGNPFDGVLYASLIGVIFYSTIAASVQKCNCQKEQDRPAAKKEAAPAKPEAGPRDAAKAAGVPKKEMRQDYIRYVRETMKPRQMRGPEPMKPRSANFNPAKMRVW